MIIKFNDDNFGFKVYSESAITLSQDLNPSTGDYFQTKKEAIEWLEEYYKVSFGLNLYKISIQVDEDNRNVIVIEFDEKIEDGFLLCYNTTNQTQSDVIRNSNSFMTIAKLIDGYNVFNFEGSFTIDSINYIPCLEYENAIVNY